VRTLWIKCCTTSLEPQVANLVELAWLPVIDGELPKDGIRHIYVQPLLHEEDQTFGSESLPRFIKAYHRQREFSPISKLAMFSLDDQPQFHYHPQAARVHGQDLDPLEWLIGKNKMMPKVAYRTFREDLLRFPGTEPWAIAGHGVGFDFNVLLHWVQRVYGSSQGLFEVLDCKAQFDTSHLARFAKALGKLNYDGRATLANVSKACNLEMPEYGAQAWLSCSYKIAQKLMRSRDENSR